MFGKRKKSLGSSQPIYKSYYSRYVDSIDSDDTYYSSSSYKRPSLFDRVKFYEKPDLIKPTLHYIDEMKIDRIVEQSLDPNDATTQWCYDSLKSSAKFDSIQSYCKKMKSIYERFPKHIIYDIFKLYYNTMDKMEFADRTVKNKPRYKILEVSNNPINKIMTHGSNLKSAVFTKNIMLFLLSQFAQKDAEESRSFEKFKKILEDRPNRNKEQSADLEDKLNNMLAAPDSKELLEKLMESAASVCTNLDQNTDQEIQDSVFNGSNNSGIGISNLTENGMKELSSRINAVKIQTDELKKKVKHLVDRSMSQFDAKTTVEYEDFINASDVSNLDEYGLLHPNIRSLFIEDILIPKKKTMGKVDIYVDVSGSMNDNCGVSDGKGGYLTKMQFSKVILSKLYEMEIIRDFYLFDTSVEKRKTTFLNICLFNGNGGTCIDTCVSHVMNVSKINSIIITDAEDRCSIYSDKVFFLGLKGARFDSFNKHVYRKYGDGKQMVIFDGKKVKEIN